MSAVHATRQPTTRYIEYLEMYSTRRLKRSPSAAPADGAGLLAGTRYHGRDTPLRGKGLAPVDDKESPAMVGGIRMVAGASFPSTDVLNTVRPITAEDHTFRASVRQFKSALESSMQGAGAIMTQKDEMRPVRRHGAEAPLDGVAHTKRRVQCDAIPMDGNLECWEVARRSSVRTWNLPSRPVNSDSITRHRYSDPSTDAMPVKLESERMPNPALVRPVPEESRAAWTGAVDSYCKIRSRAMFGSSFRFE